MSENACCCTEETLAMASVPMQEWCDPYKWDTALYNGSIFPCLNLEFYDAKDIPCPLCENGGKLSEHEKKLNEISTIGFALVDLTLYLDTHPDCKKGLTLFKELSKKRLEGLAEYAREYNPLTQLSMITGTPDSDTYGWGKGPAPWEGGLV